MKMKKKKNTIEQVGEGLGVVGKGFGSLFAMAKGDWDKAYELTHGKKTVKAVVKNNSSSNTTKKPDLPGAVTFKCPNCQRIINYRVKKCVCGMEFK